MSRLPRPQSSPDAKGFVPSLKRKIIPEEDDIEEQPAKKGPASTGFRPKPLQASRNATNAIASGSTTSASTTSSKPAAASKPAAVMPRPLTRPRPPVAARPTSRGASAPPVSTVTVRKPSSSRVPAALGKRTASGGATATAAAPDVITNLHKRLATLESARTQDTERLASLLESSAAATSSSSAAASAAVVVDAQTQAELLAAQAQLASTTAQLGSATAQLLSLQTEFGAAQGALRAREAAEADARRENLALKAEVLAGKTALAAAQDESSGLRRALAREREEGEIRARRGERLLREAKDDLEECEGKLAKVRKELEGAVSGEVGMQERCRVLEGRAERLAGEVAQLQAEKTAWAVERAGWDVEREAWEVEKRRGEEERRSLHGMVMELKGNIRVFCRVWPVLSDEEAGAEIAYPDAGLPYPSGQKEIVLSSTGAEREWDAGMGNKARREVWGFGFDRVFTPASTQADLFAEISQLAQSCTDGYNVCIFAYGQTGSGKSWTMEGGGTEETQGMIPRAVAQVFRVAEELKDKGWTYTMEGQFLEIIDWFFPKFEGRHGIGQVVVWFLPFIQTPPGCITFQSAGELQTEEVFFLFPVSGTIIRRIQFAPTALLRYPEAQDAFKECKLALLDRSYARGAPETVSVVLEAEVFDLAAVFLDLGHDGVGLRDRYDAVLESVRKLCTRRRPRSVYLRDLLENLRGATPGRRAAALVICSTALRRRTRRIASNRLRRSRESGSAVHHVEPARIEG
ncbi:hypothetical protein DFH08DRAFT_940865 [Mycena albidolilacea]|uniref:Kinesin motor domain-containing protein n=1 Tax=Mycena albidolilacea TaxID=1033008 RepID=A0AAD7EI18_9AGAR|nr:hypothetical protein DFH08DRAFT_940865 [Mycena albidolilacea]